MKKVWLKNCRVVVKGCVEHLDAYEDVEDGVMWVYDDESDYYWRLKDRATYENTTIEVESADIYDFKRDEVLLLRSAPEGEYGLIFIVNKHVLETWALRHQHLL